MKHKSIWIGGVVGVIFGIMIIILTIKFWTEMRSLRYIVFYIPGKIMTIMNICPDWFRILDCPFIILVTIIFYTLMGILIGYLYHKTKKIKYYLFLVMFIAIIVMQTNLSIAVEENEIGLIIQNINVSIDSPSAIRSGNEVVVRVIVKNLNSDIPIVLNYVNILNSKDEVIRTSNENKFIKPIEQEVAHLDKLNNLRYSKSCTPETEREYYETAMKVKNNTFSKGFSLDIRDFDSNPKIGENITIPIRIKFSYNNENFIIDKFHTIPISEPLPAPPHNSPGWYKGDLHIHSENIL